MSTSPTPTQCPSPSQSFHYPGCLNLSIVQHNCLGSSNVFQNLFSFFTSIESSPHIVALQDIPLWRNCPPVFRNHKCFFPPATEMYKPRVATYVHERLLSVISILPLFFERGDLMAVNFHSPEGLLILPRICFVCTMLIPSLVVTPGQFLLLICFLNMTFLPWFLGTSTFITLLPTHLVCFLTMICL